MPFPISVIIPSYRNPEYLDLCLQTATENQHSKDNQFIVVLDGFAEESEHIVSKYKGIEVIRFPENMGQTKAHNTGVTMAEHDRILIVNDDNVFPLNWDIRLNFSYSEINVVSPNQVEPTPSIFKNFEIKDYGQTPFTFDRDEFEGYQFLVDEKSINHPKFTSDGATWPLFMSKKWFMILGGIDPYFPSPAVADWDFFLRCELAGLQCVRYYGCHFYHFGSVATKKVEDASKHNNGEAASFDYFAWKWGALPTLDTNHNKRPAFGEFRGIKI